MIGGNAVAHAKTAADGVAYKLHLVHRKLKYIAQVTHDKI